MFNQVPHLLLRSGGEGAHAAHLVLRHVRHGVPLALRAQVVHGEPEGEVPDLPAAVGGALRSGRDVRAETTCGKVERGGVAFQTECGWVGGAVYG